MVHGNPTWSFYYRGLIRALNGEHRCIAPDNLGCGLSDKPQDWPYRLDGHVRNLEALVEALDLRDITLVVHDWGGAIGMGHATRQPERYRRFVVLNTAAFLSRRIAPSIASVRIPGFGALAVRGFNAFAALATRMAVSKPLSPEVARALTWPYGSWADRIATLRFVQDIPLRPEHPSHGTLEAIDRALSRLRGKPMLICWGEDDFCFTPAFREQWTERFPEATVHAWEGVGHYVMEDAPERVVAAIEAWARP
jgi:haloalkane dehalogenase